MRDHLLLTVPYLRRGATACHPQLDQLQHITPYTVILGNNHRLTLLRMLLDKLRETSENNNLEPF
jgi:hypothetical protein